MSVHVAGVLGLVIIFIVGTLRPVSLGVLALVATFLMGTFMVGEAPREMYSGFPVDLFVLLTGVTYLFGIAIRNGTVDWIVETAVRRAAGRRQLVPWIVFALAAAPAMAGALGSTGVALLAPLAMRVAERCEIDRRLMGLMVVHGAAAGNFSPLNVLGAIVHQAVTTRGLTMSVWTLFAGNLIANIILAGVLVVIFGGRRPFAAPAVGTGAQPAKVDRSGLALDQVSTVAALAVVAFVALRFGFSIGFLAFAAGALLQLAFPKSSEGAERHVAWSVVLLVCGVVTYVGALQRYGTVTAVGQGIAAMGTPLTVAFLLCAVGAVTSAFASSAGILGAMIPLAAPLMMQGSIGTTGLVTALSLSATLVDAAPFSTVGALAVANASESERTHVYRGLLAWGGAMVVISPIVTWLVFILPAS
jgi:Na+/H+ antiporter NhaD/arsenite permease-like protein